MPGHVGPLRPLNLGLGRGLLLSRCLDSASALHRLCRPHSTKSPKPPRRSWSNNHSSPDVDPCRRPSPPASPPAYFGLPRPSRLFFWVQATHCKKLQSPNVSECTQLSLAGFETFSVGVPQLTSLYLGGLDAVGTATWTFCWAVPIFHTHSSPPYPNQQRRTRTPGGVLLLLTRVHDVLTDRCSACRCPCPI